MKKIITILSIFLFAGIITVSAQCCKNSQKSKSCPGKSVCSQTRTTGSVKAYYFHGTRRCATCKAVEAVTKETIKEFYGDKVIFKSINLEDKNNLTLIKKHKINGQTLLIVNEAGTVNLTNEAFLNARTNPEKLKWKLKSTIDSMK